MDNNVAVLVSSCDAYSDIWDFFFYFVETYWKDCPYQFYLLNESLPYNRITSSGQEVHVINCKSKKWSKRILKALDCIPEEYIIFTLEDYFLLQDVNQNEISECVEFLKTHFHYGCINFESYVGNPFSTEDIIDNFRIMDKRENYLVNASIALWRKAFFKHALRPYETPWDFERYGTIRARHYRQNTLVLSPNKISPTKFYVKGKGGYGISGGKWAPNTVNLFKKHGISCDFEKRGFYDVDKIYQEMNTPMNPKLSFIQKLFLPIMDWELFKKKMSPRMKKLVATIDLEGRFKELLIGLKHGKF